MSCSRKRSFNECKDGAGNSGVAGARIREKKRFRRHHELNRLQPERLRGSSRSLQKRRRLPL